MKSEIFVMMIKGMESASYFCGFCDESRALNVTWVKKKNIQKEELTIL